MDPRQFTVSNTLVCLIQGMQGQTVEIDLRNGCSVFGLLSSCDASMNCHLRKGYIQQSYNYDNSHRPQSLNIENKREYWNNVNPRDRYQKRLEKNQQSEKENQGKAKFGCGKSAINRSDYVTGRTNFEDFYLQGKHIRYVHLPESVSIYGAMQSAIKQREQMFKADNKTKKKHADPERFKGAISELGLPANSIERFEPIIGGDLDINL